MNPTYKCKSEKQISRKKDEPYKGNKDKILNKNKIDTIKG